jgi:hypothetical protein
MGRGCHVRKGRIAVILLDQIEQRAVGYGSLKMNAQFDPR